ncbi:hypothetical protein CV751_27990 [Achromobacter ruhlandii]|nr:hypothetical protein CV751_27990 [Achromobacter ruhlandii]
MRLGTEFVEALPVAGHEIVQALAAIRIHGFAGLGRGIQKLTYLLCREPLLRAFLPADVYGRQSPRLPGYRGAFQAISQCPKFARVVCLCSGRHRPPFGSLGAAVLIGLLFLARFLPQSLGHLRHRGFIGYRGARQGCAGFPLQVVGELLRRGRAVDRVGDVVQGRLQRLDGVRILLLRTLGRLAFVQRIECKIGRAEKADPLIGYRGACQGGAGIPVHAVSADDGEHVPAFRQRSQLLVGQVGAHVHIASRAQVEIRHGLLLIGYRGAQLGQRGRFNGDGHFPVVVDRLAHELAQDALALIERQHGLRFGRLGGVVLVGHFIHH